MTKLLWIWAWFWIALMTLPCSNSFASWLYSYSRPHSRQALIRLVSFSDFIELSASWSFPQVSSALRNRSSLFRSEAFAEMLLIASLSRPRDFAKRFHLTQHLRIISSRTELCTVPSMFSVKRNTSFQWYHPPGGALPIWSDRYVPTPSQK